MKKAFLRIAWLLGIVLAIAAVCLVNIGFNFIWALVIELAGIITAFLSWGALKNLKAEAQWAANRKTIHHAALREDLRRQKDA